MTSDYDDKDNDKQVQNDVDGFLSEFLYDSMIARYFQLDVVQIATIISISCIILPKDSLPWYFGILLVSIMYSEKIKNED
jgi:hypothetical protein